MSAAGTPSSPPVLLRGVEEGALADEGGGEVEAEAVHLGKIAAPCDNRRNAV